MKSSSVVLIEFNELCPTLLDKFIGQGLLPNFKKFREESTAYVTDASKDMPNLEPWIQWVNVHAGMSFSEHGVFRLGDGKKLKAKLLGQCLSAAGIPVGICSSMNTEYGALSNGYVLPDPWSDGTPSPTSLNAFHRIIANQVQESSNDKGMSVGQAASFLLFMLRNGLSAGTIGAILRQLLSEKRDRGVRWRRASLLGDLQYDAFKSLNKKHGVRFATFFSNSTAHYQHYFWRNMEPELFAVPPSSKDHSSLKNAILTGYQDMDRLLGRFFRDYDNSLLILCTALSQQPWVDTQKVTFRPRDFNRFMQFAGLDAEKIEIKPVMAEQFHVVCSDQEAARRVYERLMDIKVEDRPLMFARLEGVNVFSGCAFIDEFAEGRTAQRMSDGKVEKFDDLFYRIHSIRSGKHHPDGVLWIRNHKAKKVEQKIPLTAIAPTILAHFGVAPPATMTETPLTL